MKFFITQWFKNVPIRKKLYFLVGFMSLFIAIQLLALSFSLTTLSSFRAFVTTEGLWSKDQKNAVYHLQKYSSTHNEEDYQLFLEFMKRPLGAHVIATELNKKNPNFSIVRMGFSERNHPDDVNGMIKLFERFHNTSYFNRVLSTFSKADSIILQLFPIAENLHREIGLKSASQENINTTIAQIAAINMELTGLENNFSYTLGVGSRWIEKFILITLLMIVLLVALFGLFFTISVTMGITKGINEIIRVAAKISVADFSDKAKVYSQDEIGQLAISFNKMVDNLQQNINERVKVEDAIKIKDEETQAIFDNAPDAIVVIDSKSNVVKWNPIAEKIFGWTKEEVVGKPLYDFIIPLKYREQHIQGMKHFLETGVGPFLNKSIEIEALNKQNNLFSASLSISPTIIKDQHLFIGFVRDISKRKETEEVMKEQQHLYESLIKTQSEMGQGIAIIENEKIIYANDALYKMCGYSQEDILNLSFFDMIIPEDKKNIQEQINKYLSGYEIPEVEETSIIHKDGTVINIEYSARKIKMNVHTQLLLVIRNITFRKKVEEELRNSEYFLDSIVENIPNMIFVKDAKDLKFVRFNKAGEELIGHSREELLGKNDYDFFPKEEADFFTTKDKEVLENRKLIDIPEERIKTNYKGTRILETKKIPILDKHGNPAYLLGISNDITQRINSEIELKQKSMELLRSNEELEQFAYVASHDLQEPLRMVNSYVQLLSDRYKDKLDKDANDFIAFAIDGSNRMRNLIQSLLEYSRVNRDITFEQIDLNKLMETVLHDLQDSINENNAVIKIDKLPTVVGDNILLGQLFQNLISNAIKFRSKENPEIIISGKKVKNEYHFFVKDNGIGISKEYLDKIFVIFKRLNSKEKYPGTGIGLAICKKIVERFGGRIWVESEAGKGSTFFFTLKHIKETSIDNKTKSPKNSIVKPAAELIE